MKKSLSVFLALLMILSSLPIMTIGASAGASADPNVLADYKAEDWLVRSYGNVTESNESSKGGYAYFASGIVFQRMVTTVTLKPNTTYDFNFDWKAVLPDDNSGAGIFPSFIYVYPMSVIGELTDTMDKSATAGSGKWNTNAEFFPKVGDGKLDANDDIESASDAYFTPNKALLAEGNWSTINTRFDTTNDTEYVIMIRFRNNDKGNGKNQIILSDLSLTQNLLSKSGNANGDVTWSDNADVRASSIDSTANSVKGGSSWTFGLGNTNYTSAPAYVYINAKNLKANYGYNFSYIYQGDFVIVYDSIKDKDNNVIAPLSPATDLAITGGDRAHKVTSIFKVPTDGDYTITLKMGKGKNNVDCVYSAVTLCDLALSQSDVAIHTVGVSKEGNGFAKVSNQGYANSGSTVTFTAKAMDYENFLGWYNGEELVSKDLVYNAVITNDTHLVAKFTTNSENILGNYTASNWRAWRYASIADANVSPYGSNSYKITESQYQKVFTVVTLEKNTNYKLSFNWKAILSATGDGAYPSQIYVIPRSKMGTTEQVMNADKNNAAASQWAEKDAKFTVVGQTEYFDFAANDIENSDCFSICKAAATNIDWNSYSTTFTTVDEPDYVIVFQFSRVTDGKDLYFSDFVLKAEAVDESNLMAYKDIKDWGDHRYSKISASNESRFGGNGFLVEQAMFQNVFTALKLKPGTSYSFSFEWKSVANEGSVAYPEAVKIYPVAAGDPFDTASEIIWNDNIYLPADGFNDLARNVTYPDKEVIGSLDWQTLTGEFTTNEYSEYRMIIYFGREKTDAEGGYNNAQKINLSDFTLKEVVKGDAPSGDNIIAHPGVSIRKANESVNGQAIRYKFTVDNEVIKNAQTDGYELVEYGAAVVYADDLNGFANDPILNSEKYTVHTGVAYKKDFGATEPTKNVQYAIESNGDVTYTIALYNIAKEKYSAQLSVRPYAKFQNAEGDTYIRYGTTRTASVFDVVKAVLEGDNIEDIDYVNNVLLAGDIKNAYDVWVSEK